jgi:hypothetical protein
VVYVWDLGHDHLKLFLLLVLEVSLLVIALAVVVLIGVVILVRRVELLPLRVVGEVSGVATLEAAPT